MFDVSKLKKDKEFVLFLDGLYCRTIITKTIKDKFGKVESIDVTDTHTSLNYSFTLEEFKEVYISSPITNSEFFVMYTNWINFTRKGVHQNLVYAEKVRQSIINSLEEIKFVKHGTGKFEDYDYKLLKNLGDNKYD